MLEGKAIVELCKLLCVPIACQPFDRSKNPHILSSGCFHGLEMVITNR